MKKWSIHSKQSVYKNRWRPIEMWEMINPSGVKVKLFIETGKDAVIVFCLTKNKKVILIDQFFYAQNAKHSTLIAGYVEDGNTPMTQAKQELLEEAGGIAKKFVHIGSYFRTKYNTGTTHFVLALDVERKHEQVLEVVEDIDVQEITLKEFVKKLMKGKIQGAVECACAHTALQYLIKKKLIDVNIFSL